MSVPNIPYQFISKEIYEPAYTKLVQLSYQHSNLMILAKQFRNQTGRDSNDISYEISTVLSSMADIVKGFVDRNEHDND